MSQQPTQNAIEELFPYLIVRDAAAAIDFYSHVFGAEETMRLSEPGGRVGHAMLKFGSATVMLADEHPEYGITAPPPAGATGSYIHLHVANVDELTNRAVEAGAKIVMEPKTQFYGERTAKVLDPYGHYWLLGQHVEDVSP
jgi:PhnB protein